MVVPEQPETLENRCAGMQRRMVADRDLEAFVIFLACLPAKLVLGLLVGAAVVLVLFPDDTPVRVDEHGALVEQFLGCGYVARP